MNLKDVLAIEDVVETAACRILKAGGATAVPEFSDGQKNESGEPVPDKLPLYEVKVVGVAEDGDKFRYHGVQMPREWEATLIIRSVTKRFESSNLNAGMAADVRVHAFHFNERFNAILQYHVIKFMREITTTPGHQPETLSDLREQHYRIRIMLRDEVVDEFRDKPAG